DGHFAVGRGGGNGEGGGLDSVRNDIVLDAVQFLHAGDRNRRAARAYNLGAHLVQEVRKIHHFGLARGAFNGSHAFGENSRHHQIRSAEHRRTRSSPEENV